MCALLFKKRVLRKKNMEETVFLNCSHAQENGGIFLHLWNVGRTKYNGQSEYSRVWQEEEEAVNAEITSHVTMDFMCAQNAYQFQYQNNLSRNVSAYTVYYGSDKDSCGYRLKNSSAAECYRYFFSMEHNAVIAHLFNLEEQTFFRCRDLKEPYRVMEELYYMAENASSYTPLDISVKLFEFLSLLSMGNTLQNPGGKLRTAKDLLHYVSVFPQNFPTIKSLTELFQVSEITLHHLFHKETNTSPMGFVIYYRLYNSCWQLRQTSIPIGEIAKLNGYNSVQFYSRAFKKEFGISPAQYRQNALISSPEKEKKFCRKNKKN